MDTVHTKSLMRTQVIDNRHARQVSMQRPTELIDADTNTSHETHKIIDSDTNTNHETPTQNLYADTSTDHETQTQNLDADTHILYWGSRNQHHPGRVISHPRVINPSIHLQTQQTGDKNGDLPGRYRPARCGNPNSGAHHLWAGIREAGGPHPMGATRFSKFINHDPVDTLLIMT